VTVALALQLAGLACFAVSYALIYRHHGRSQRAAGREEAEEEHRSRVGALVGSATFMPTFTPFDDEAHQLHERLPARKATAEDRSRMVDSVYYRYWRLKETEASQEAC